MRNILLAAFLLLPATGIFATNEPLPVVVYVEHDGDDDGGERLVFRLKEMIRKSGGFKLSSSRENSLVISIVTMPYFPSPRVETTMYSVTWEADIKGPFPIKYNSTLGYCGSAKLSEAAERLLSRTDDVVAGLQAIRDALNQ